MSLDRLISALQAQGLQATFDDLCDIVWLASLIGEVPAELGTAPAARLVGAPSSARPELSPPSSSASPPLGTTTRLPVDTTDGAEAPSLYGAAGDSGTRAARRVQLRGQPALPQGLAIARALRPLSRRRLGPQRELDERATAERIADTGLRQPVWRQAFERWFHIVLVVEDVPSLSAWQPMVDAFSGVLQRQGGFRSVSRLVLRLENGALQARMSNGSPVSPSGLADREQRRLALVLSDCTSAAWRDGMMGVWLQQIAPRLPVAVAPLLPPALWPNTAVGFAELRVSARQPATPTARLRVARPGWAVGEPGLVMPLLALEPIAVASWARMVIAAGEAWSTAALLPLVDEEAPIPLQPQPPTPAERLAAFRGSAGINAQRLAAYFSVVRPLTAPLMRVIHRAMAPVSGAVDLAQVFLGGLLQRVRAGSTPDDAAYDFYPGLREPLQLGLTRHEFVQINLALHDFLQQQAGTVFDFFALLEDREGGEHLPDAALPFVQMARSAAARFGGQLADPQEDSPASDSIAEIEISAGDRVLNFYYRSERSVSEMVQQLPLEEAADLASSFSGRNDPALLNKLRLMAMPGDLHERGEYAVESEWAQLLLDTTTARFPWELLFASGHPGPPPLAVRCGMTRRRLVSSPRLSAGKQGGALVIGSPAVPLTSYPPLPGVAREAKAVAEILSRMFGPNRAQLLVDADNASVARAVRDLPGLHALHLAAHTEVLPETVIPESSLESRIRIVLGGDLRLGLAHFVKAGRVPEFIFLGAVQTAALAMPLLVLGARVVVAVAGNIRDDEAAVYATAFYTALEAGKTLLEATRQARRECFQVFPDSDAWGRFQVWGDPDWRLVADDPAPAREHAVEQPAQLRDDLATKIKETFESVLKHDAEPFQVGPARRGRRGEVCVLAA